MEYDEMMYRVGFIRSVYDGETRKLSAGNLKDEAMKDLAALDQLIKLVQEIPEIE